MNAADLITLKKRINVLTLCSYVIWVFNIFLIVIPCWHYYNLGFQVPMDMYFFWVVVLNIFGFNLAYLVTDKLVYFKKKHIHFSEKL